jgi:hypothetical protein
MSPYAALRILKQVERDARVANDMLVDCASEGEREVVVDKALDLLRRGVVKRVIVDVRLPTAQVAIMFHDPSPPGTTK